MDLYVEHIQKNVVREIKEAVLDGLRLKSPKIKDGGIIALILISHFKDILDEEDIYITVSSYFYSENIF